MKQAFIILLSSLLLLSSCDEDFFTTTVEVDPPEHTPKLVLHAFNLDMFTVVAQVTHTTAPGEIQQSGIDRYLYDADVHLYRNGELVGELEVVASETDPNEYNYAIQFQQPIIPGVEYRIEAVHPDYPSVQSTSVMPAPIAIKKVQFVLEGGVDETGSERSAIEVTLTDPEDRINFYEASILISQSRSTYVSSLDPSVSKSVNYNDVLISDASFDGEDKILRLQIGISNINENNLFLVWKNITEDQFSYSKTIRRLRDLGDNPFASPVQIKGNIENGFGIFGLINEQRFKVVK